MELKETGDPGTSREDVEILAVATVWDDYDKVLAEIDARMKLLELFLSSPQRRDTGKVLVMSMKLSCGEGFEATGRLCTPCNQNHYKHSPANISCSPCPVGSFTANATQGFSKSVHACRCPAGSRPSTQNSSADDIDFEDQLISDGDSSSVKSSLYWVGRPECVAVLEEATVQRVAEVVTSVVTSVIGVQIAVTVATSVAASVSATVGASVASGAGPSAMSNSGGSMALVTQVQFLSMTGKVGGSQGSDALRNFSSGFEWANYRLGLTNGADGEKPRGSASRRQKKGAKVAGKDSAGNETGTEPSEMDCSWEVGAPVVEVWGTCIVCLLAVSISRSLLVFILEHVLKKKTSPALLFPAWEGPVVLTQIIALADSAFESMGTEGCAGWKTFGSCLFLIGPFCFFAFAATRLHHHLRSGDLRYMAAPRPTWAELRLSVSEAKGGFGKFSAIQAYYGKVCMRGEWNSDNPHARHWSFILGDMGYLGIGYAVWLLGKRIFVSGTMQLSDGSVNALLSITIQTFDSILLFLLRPFNDNQVTTQEALGGLTSTAAYFALGLPAVLGPSFALDEITVLLLSMFGVVISAVSSALAQVSAALTGISACLACAGVLAGPASIPTNDIAAEAGQSALESAQAGIEEESTETMSAPLGASALGLAYGIGRSALAQVKSDDAGKGKDVIETSMIAEEKWQCDSVREWCTAMPSHCPQYQSFQKLSYEAWCTAIPRAAPGRFDLPVLLSSPRLMTEVTADQATRGCGDLHRILDCNANTTPRVMGMTENNDTHPSIHTNRVDPPNQIQLSARADLVYFPPGALPVLLPHQKDVTQKSTVPINQPVKEDGVVQEAFAMPKAASDLRATIQRPLSSAFHDDLAPESAEPSGKAHDAEMIAMHNGDNFGGEVVEDDHTGALQEASRGRSASVGTPRSAARHPDTSPYTADVKSVSIIEPLSPAGELDESVHSKSGAHDQDVAAFMTARSTAVSGWRSVCLDLKRQESNVAPPSRQFHKC